MRSAFGCLVVTGALFFSSPVLAGDEKSTAPAGEKPEAAAECPSPGKAPKVMVAVDPVTGKLRAPTAAEREALQALQAGATKALVRVAQPTLVERLPDGHVRARLGPEHARYSVARVNPDGTLSLECVPAGRVDANVRAAAPASPAAAEK
jgi:hypothetical protein